MTRKVKIIFVHSVSTYDSYGDYDGNFSVLGPATTDWEEVDDEKVQELKDNINYLNRTNMNRNSVYHGSYVLVEYGERVNQMYCKDIAEFQRRVEKARKDAEDQKRREEEERERKRLAREAKSLEKKRLQFEKLKKELGEG